MAMALQVSAFMNLLILCVALNACYRYMAFHAARAKRVTFELLRNYGTKVLIDVVVFC